MVRVAAVAPHNAPVTRRVQQAAAPRVSAAARGAREAQGATETYALRHSWSAANLQLRAKDSRVGGRTNATGSSEIDQVRSIQKHTVVPDLSFQTGESLFCFNASCMPTSGTYADTCVPPNISKPAKYHDTGKLKRSPDLGKLQQQPKRQESSVCLHCLQ